MDLRSQESCTGSKTLKALGCLTRMQSGSMSTNLPQYVVGKDSDRMWSSFPSVDTKAWMSGSSRIAMAKSSTWEEIIMRSPLSHARQKAPSQGHIPEVRDARA
ncbi:unnamed protein product [Polarella glacialis]|uniref:Uncharacterized protein n=1 Tax=Polarella glacialis TaxID=89957 RepID=A0A813DK33_POLGL|nr:unnamed protein product [Polarella glacialis]